jgi:hypothetical protein
MSHEPQSFTNPVVGKNRQKWRLLELDGKGLLECSVENGIACRVDKVGEDDSVLVGELR